jgi:hypothetical protein
MTAFNIDLNTEQPDRIFVEVDRRFDVAIERTETGLALRVYPAARLSADDHGLTLSHSPPSVPPRPGAPRLL